VSELAFTAANPFAAIARPFHELWEAIECEAAFCLWCGAYLSPRHFDLYDGTEPDPRVQFLGSYLVARDSASWRSSREHIRRICR
jgi:hypothetical protein